MGFILTLLGLPALGPVQLVHWLAGALSDQALREYLDEGRVRGDLMELQERYEAGEFGEEEYDRRERVLLERLEVITEWNTAVGTE
ncbi:MAG: gas vesicle protein GvpG [Chloroflexota bacterium]